MRGQLVPCRFCGAPDGDGHLFGEFTFPPVVHDLMMLLKVLVSWLRFRLDGIHLGCQLSGVPPLSMMRLRLLL